MDLVGKSFGVVKFSAAEQLGSSACRAAANKIGMGHRDFPLDLRS